MDESSPQDPKPWTSEVCVRCGGQGHVSGASCIYCTPATSTQIAPGERPALPEPSPKDWRQVVFVRRNLFPDSSEAPGPGLQEPCGPPVIVLEEPSVDPEPLPQDPSLSILPDPSIPLLADPSITLLPDPTLPPLSQDLAGPSCSSSSSDRIWSCASCSKTFSTKFKLLRHALIHSSERGYTCGTCHRSFTRKDHLANHMKVHSNVRLTILCSYKSCGKQYSSKLSFRKHLAVHAAHDGDLQCRICGQAFESKESVLAHLKVHSGSRSTKTADKKFQCEICSRHFFTGKDVRRHMVVHTGKRDFLCQFCPQRFGRKDHLVRHIKKSHSSVVRKKAKRPPSVKTVDSVLQESAGGGSTSVSGGRAEGLLEPELSQLGDLGPLGPLGMGLAELSPAASSLLDSLDSFLAADNIDPDDLRLPTFNQAFPPGQPPGQPPGPPGT